MKKGWLLYISMLAFCLVAVASLFESLRRNPAPAEPLLGQTIEFALTGSDGGAISNRDLLGRKYALLFYRPDCDYCVRELVQLDRLRSEFVDQFDLLRVSIVEQGFSEELKAGLKHEIEYYRPSTETQNRLRVGRVPMLLLVNENGMVVYSQFGLRADDFLKLLVDRFVRNQSLSEPALRRAYLDSSRSGGIRGKL